MRLDPKYFNLFLGICAILTLIVIIWGTIRYVNNQQIRFERNLQEINLSEIYFQEYATGDSLSVKEFRGEPVVIHFWSTWSERSMNVNIHIENVVKENPELVVLAAAARDDADMVIEYMEEYEFPFRFVNGTDYYLDLLVPGLPSQIFIDKNGEIVGSQVGSDSDELRTNLENLLSIE